MREPPPPFTAAERGFLRHALGAAPDASPPALEDGVALPVWRSGARRGEAKLPPALASLAARGLMEVAEDGEGARARFTELGLHALRRLVADGRSLDPERFGHLYDELGVDRPDPDKG